MRKFVPVAAALVIALAGCSSAPKTEEAPAEPEAVEEEAVEQEEEPVDEGVSIEWTDAKDATEAAKGAGFDKFGVIAKFNIGDLEYKDPTFAYAGGVAQATYETPATAIYLRKAVDTYETPLSDRHLDEFSARWNKILEGIDIACYGPAKGAVTVATWSDGNKSFGLTFQGLGGDEMTMDVDELAAIVKGIKEADADEKATEEKKEEKKEEQKTEQTQTQTQQKQQSSSSTQQGSLLSDKEAEAIVEKACDGTCISIDLVTTKQYGQCWYAVCVDGNGNRFEYYVNNSGAYIIDEKGAQRETVTPQTPAKKDGHYEGEPVTIYGSIYAEWHQANGAWVATFVTYNGTQIFATPASAGGGWVFNAYRNGKSVQVIYSDQESSASGEVGPAGVSSHWCNINDYHDWY